MQRLRFPRSYWFLPGLWISLAAAESLYRRALQLDPAYPDAHYNLACVQALRHQTDAAPESLRLALVHGFDDLKSLREDPDLTSLRDIPVFYRLAAAYFPELHKR